MLLNRKFNTFTLPTILIAYLPKFCTRIIFDFSWVLLSSREKAKKNNAYALFWEVNIRKHFQMTTAAILVFQTNPVGVEKLNSFFM